MSVSRDTVITRVMIRRILCDRELAGCVARSVENVAGETVSRHSAEVLCADTRELSYSS